MKIKTVKIMRWNKKEQKHIGQEIQVDSLLGFSICARKNHQYCSHSEEMIVMRNQDIEAIHYYPASEKLMIFTRKENENEIN